MKRLAASLLVLVMLPAAAFAAPRGVGGYLHDAGQKLAYGVANVVWAPTELVSTPTGFLIETRGFAPYYPVYLVTGVVYGTFAGAWRVVDGLLDIATFPYAPQKDRWAEWEWVTYRSLGRPIPED